MVLQHGLEGGDLGTLVRCRYWWHRHELPRLSPSSRARRHHPLSHAPAAIRI